MRSKESPCLVSSALRIERSLRYPSRSPLRFGIRLDDLLEKVEQLLRVFLLCCLPCEYAPPLGQLIRGRYDGDMVFSASSPHPGLSLLHREPRF